jgi:D-beta-D-heptose 7-phosphate kinase/D-beta-D-heptose 1-phosphate adenosyltransferase
MKLFDISFQDLPILCLGDLLLDRFVYGTVNRISPEAPVPVLKINRDFLTLGGAGNVRWSG